MACPGNISNLVGGSSGSYALSFHAQSVREVTETEAPRACCDAARFHQDVALAALAFVYTVKASEATKLGFPKPPFKMSRLF